MISILKSALRNKVFWYMASRYGTFAIQFLSSIWLAVKLGPYYFGLWSFILLLVNVGSQCNWGIANAVNILLVQHKGDMAKCAMYEYNAIMLTSVACTIPFLIALYDTIFPVALFAKYQLGHLSYAVAFIVSSYYLNTLFINIFRVKNRILEIAISQSLFPLLTFLVIFVTTDRTLLMLLVLVYVFAMIVSIVLFLRPRLISFRGTVSLETVKAIFTKGFYLFLYNACCYLIMLSTKVLISIYYSVETFGYFAFAFNVANATMLFIDSLMFLLFPKMVYVLKGSDKAVIVEKIAVMRICYISTIFMLFMVATSAFAIFIQFLPKYRASFSLFVGIAVSMLIYTICFGYNIYMLAQNRERMMALLAFVSLVLNIISVWVFAALIGVHSDLIMLATTGSYLVYVICVCMVGRRAIGVRATIPRKKLFEMAMRDVLGIFKRPQLVDV